MQTSEDRRIENYAPLLNGRERDYVLQAIESGWVSYGGQYVKEFWPIRCHSFMTIMD
ncbi:protein of unknown function [Cupriavidus taiwanensis]|nr:protein of unknown function [Cupriavidus taiwanensis]